MDSHVVIPKIHDLDYELERDELSDTGRLCGRADPRYQM